MPPAQITAAYTTRDRNPSPMTHEPEDSHRIRLHGPWWIVADSQPPQAVPAAAPRVTLPSDNAQQLDEAMAAAVSVPLVECGSTWFARPFRVPTGLDSGNSVRLVVDSTWELLGANLGEHTLTVDETGSWELGDHLSRLPPQTRLHLALRFRPPSIDAPIHALPREKNAPIPFACCELRITRTTGNR